MKIYIRNEDVDRIDKSCDLGNSVGVRAYVYPHKDDLPDMKEFRHVDYLTVSLQARVKALQAAGVIGGGIIKSLEVENAALRKAVDAAQAVFNQTFCYSSGSSLMHEEDMVELFSTYSDAKEELDALSCVIPPEFEEAFKKNINDILD
jgi:hypothetical protein